MKAIVQVYHSHGEATGREPDETLLAPVKAVFENHPGW